MKLVYMMLFVLTFAGCGVKISPVPTKPDFAPVKASIVQARTAAVDTSTKAQAVVTFLQQHVADTQPAHVVVAEALPAAQAITQAASVTVARVDDVASAVAPVETQTTKVYESAVTNHDAAVHYEAKYTKERNSIFGGKIGHWLLDVIICGVAIGVLWLLSKLFLSVSLPVSWLNYIALPIHFVANLAEVAGAMLISSLKTVWSGAVWFWNEIVLKHIPWPTPSPAVSVPNPTPSAEAK